MAVYVNPVSVRLTPYQDERLRQIVAERKGSDGASKVQLIREAVAHWLSCKAREGKKK